MFKDKIRMIDIKAIAMFTIAWPIAVIRRKWHKDLWLLSERHDEARDNGYWMFRYIRENIPKQEVYYVIDKKAKDREKIVKYDCLVSHGSLAHYIIYLMASKHVSAHVDSDSPNSRVSNFLETHGLLKNKRVFLQHGITKDKISFGYYSVSRADLFVCAAKPEYEFCRKEFGYPEGAVQLLGFARYDGLGIVKPKRKILLMPTWRAWLANLDECEFKNSHFFKEYQKVISNLTFFQQLEQLEIELIFYLHSDLQKFSSLFHTASQYITIADAGNYDIQTLLNESAMLITDYSSVAFDMAYMNRPVIYYQFDYDDYRKMQHPEGYFSYSSDGFGQIVKTDAELVNATLDILNKNFQVDAQWKTRRDKFFTFSDHRNCHRIYEAIMKL